MKFNFFNKNNSKDNFSSKGNFSNSDGFNRKTLDSKSLLSNVVRRSAERRASLQNRMPESKKQEQQKKEEQKIFGLSAKKNLRVGEVRRSFSRNDNKIYKIPGTSKPFLQKDREKFIDRVFGKEFKKEVGYFVDEKDMNLIIKKKTEQLYRTRDFKEREKIEQDIEILKDQFRKK